MNSVGEQFTYATVDPVMQYGDVILVAGTIAKAERFAGRRGRASGAGSR
ncbi:hypothetical protein [Actinomadura chokoriensis]